MREQPYDVVHLATPGSMGLVGRALANRSKRALVGTYHTHLADYGAMRSSVAMRKLIHGLSWEFLRWFYAPCVSVLGPTEGVVEELRRRRFRNQLGVFTRGIDLDLYNVGRRQRHDGDVVTSYVGRLAPEKNVRFLPDIVSGTQSPVWIIGDGPERPWLEQKLHRARFTGYLFGEQLANAYADSDLLLFPSTTDTFGNVVLEAMASGVVPIVAKGPGPSDFVQHGENAFICEGPDGMRDAMTRLIRNPELRLNMRHNARKFAERFDWHRAVQQLLQHYRSAAVSR
jgi:glycosyltransferase involved in cell wall biosynthesis